MDEFMHDDIDASLVSLSKMSDSHVCREESYSLLEKVVYSEEEAYNLYVDYGYRRGFSVRRGKQTYFAGTKDIRTKNYYCSKEGQKEFKDCQDSAHSKLDTRTGCKAMIRCTVKDGKWTVTTFIDEHNHEFATPEERHLLRSARFISSHKAGVIDSMVNAGIATNEIYAYMSAEVGGAENIGFIKRDCYNYVNNQKLKMIEAGDGQSLMNYFKARSAEDPMFYYTVQVDQENRMTNFFWRDGRSRIDYDFFGDVVVFDTTYRTNRYGLICAPFVGVNHHWQNIMFGCAFLLDETAASFEWLFKSFLESMGNQAPKTIITDQDHAMGKAIPLVFTHTRHRLCLWHISKNAPSHVGKLLSTPGFKSLFNKCLSGCETEREFEETWQKMTNDSEEARVNKWLRHMHDIRQKWCTALNKDTFSAGFKSSQRSESTNNVLNGIAKSTTSLSNFIFGFDKLVKDWRGSEAVKDFECKNGDPTRVLRNSGILTHATKVYTHVIYKQVEKEYLSCLELRWKEIEIHESLHTFEIAGEHETSRLRFVSFDSFSMDISCSCKKFESEGYLCSHAFKVLNINNVTRIPENRILRRFTKAAKERIHMLKQPVSSEVSTDEAESVFRNRMLRMAYDFVLKCQGDDSARKICETLFLNGFRQIDKKAARSTRNNEVTDDKCVEHEVGSLQVLDPPKKAKKKTSRMKGHFEKRQRKKTENSSVGRTLEISETPQISRLATSELQPSYSAWSTPGISYQMMLSQAEQMMSFPTMIQGTNPMNFMNGWRPPGY